MAVVMETKSRLTVLPGTGAPTWTWTCQRLTFWVIFIFCLTESALTHSASTHVILPLLSEMCVPCDCRKVQCRHSELFGDARSPKQTQEQPGECVPQTSNNTCEQTRFHVLSHRRCVRVFTTANTVQAEGFWNQIKHEWA